MVKTSFRNFMQMEQRNPNWIVTTSRTSKVTRQQEAHRGDGKQSLTLLWCNRTRIPKKMRTENLTAKINNTCYPGSLLWPGNSILRESQKLIINRKNKQGFSWLENSSVENYVIKFLLAKAWFTFSDERVVTQLSSGMTDSKFAFHCPNWQSLK